MQLSVENASQAESNEGMIQGSGAWEKAEQKNK
jgi:hypothetical protein